MKAETMTTKLTPRGRKALAAGILLAMSSALAGCQFHARGPKDYEADTTKLLETKKKELKACYDAALKKDSKAGGVVAIKFTVAADTGVIGNVKVDEKKTTAPTELSECVVKNVEGLKLSPADQREGQASFTYEFKAHKK